MKLQAFAGYFRIKTGRGQSLQMSVFSRSFVQYTPDFVQQMTDFSAPQKLTGLKQLLSPNKTPTGFICSLSVHILL